MIEKDELKTMLEGVGYITSDQTIEQIRYSLLNSPIQGAIIKGVTGSGKTFLPESLSKVLDADLFSVHCHLNTDESDLIQKMIPTEETISGIKLQDNIIIDAIYNSNHSRTILAIDEYDKTRPSADSILLELLQSGSIFFNNKKYIGNLENLIIYILANEERELSEYITRRLPVIKFGLMHPSVVAKILRMKYPDNPYIKNAYRLYKSVYDVPSITKVVTIQELSQYVELLTKFNGAVDEELLIKTLISKDPATHDEIIQACNNYQDTINDYNETNTHTLNQKEVSLPGELSNKVCESKKAFQYELKPDVITKLPDTTGGYFKFSVNSYSSIAKLILQYGTLDNKEPEVLNMADNKVIITRTGNNIILHFVNEMEFTMNNVELLHRLGKIFHNNLAENEYEGKIYLTKDMSKSESSIADMMNAIMKKISERDIQIHSICTEECLFEVIESKLQFKLSLKEFGCVVNMTDPSYYQNNDMFLRDILQAINGIVNKTGNINLNKV